MSRAEHRALARWYRDVAQQYREAASVPNRPTHSFARAGSWQLLKAAEAADKKAAVHDAAAESLEERQLGDWLAHPHNSNLYRSEDELNRLAEQKFQGMILDATEDEDERVALQALWCK